MAMTSKASLAAPHAQFATNGTTSGVWKRKTVTSAWGGQPVLLKAEQESGGTCVCDIIRVGDEFFIARTFGSPQRKMEEYAQMSAARAARDAALAGA